MLWSSKPGTVRKESSHAEKTWQKIEHDCIFRSFDEAFQNAMLHAWVRKDGANEYLLQDDQQWRFGGGGMLKHVCKLSKTSLTLHLHLL